MPKGLRQWLEQNHPEIWAMYQEFYKAKRKEYQQNYMKTHYVTKRITKKESE